MKLRVFEIDAIKNKIVSTIKETLTIPDFSKEVKERTKLFNQYLVLKEEAEKAIKKKEEFADKHNFKYFNASSYNPKNYEKELIEKFVNSKLPNLKDIENDIILSGNKDLSELVNELIKKYAKT